MLKHHNEASLTVASENSRFKPAVVSSWFFQGDIKPIDTYSPRLMLYVGVRWSISCRNPFPFKIQVPFGTINPPPPVDRIGHHRDYFYLFVTQSDVILKVHFSKISPTLK